MVGQMGQSIVTGTAILPPGRPLCFVRGSLGESFPVGFSQDQVGLALDAKERRGTRLSERQLHVIIGSLISSPPLTTCDVGSILQLRELRWRKVK